MIIINIIAYIFHKKKKKLFLNFKVNYMISILKIEIKFLLKMMIINLLQIKMELQNFKIKKKFNCKKKNVSFVVGTYKDKILFTSLYTFRLRLTNKNYNELILVQSH